MFFTGCAGHNGAKLAINDQGYFEKPGLNVMVLNDIYPEGHQGGIEIIQHGKRVATNGNLSLQPTPGQWEPYPRLLDKEIRKADETIVVTLKYPDSTRIKTPDQPIIYPYLEFTYRISVIAEVDQFKIIVDLEKPLPAKWIGQVGFYLELFPGYLFGKSYHLDEQCGVFPRYANSPVRKDQDGEYEAMPMAEGRRLIVAPEDKYLKMIIENKHGTLELLDGRVKHNNGWFVVRSLIPEKATNNAIEWVIKPNTVSGWKYGPVIHTSQLGYHSNQTKKAIIELDRRDKSRNMVKIKRVRPEGGFENVLSIRPEKCQDFLRYRYLRADFTDVSESGIYVVEYGDKLSEQFQIGPNVYQQGVWQPTLEYFLPVQMCHMKIFEKYRVWHDQCHLDDALMAPENINHFDTYVHGKVPGGFTPLAHVPGLNRGGWHDAGDYDLRIESQIGTILTLAYAFEEFHLNHDQTLIDQEDGIVEIHHPDGKPDVLQQIEHGLLTVLGGYRQFGKFYRGILCPTLRQYALMGDAGSMTDNRVFTGKVKGRYEGFWYNRITNKYSKYFSPQMNEIVEKEYVEDLDDRLVFLEDDSSSQIYGIAGLAAAARVLWDYNNPMAQECLAAAEDLWMRYRDAGGKRAARNKIQALAELILTTDKKFYKDALTDMLPEVIDNIQDVGWTLGRVLSRLKDENFKHQIHDGILKVKTRIDELSGENPFGIPYHPNIWGAGWGIQRFGFKHYFLYTGWPDIFTIEPMLNALNFILGCHPGENTASFVSGVGTKSMTVAYGSNRAEWSFIPGGVCSGTNLVRPDLPELLEWPFLWQQSEYVLGGGATNFMFLVLGADKILNNK